MTVLLLSLLSAPSHALGWDRASFSEPAFEEAADPETVLILNAHPQEQQGEAMMSLDIVLKHLPELAVTSLALSIDGVPIDTGAAFEGAIRFADEPLAASLEEEADEALPPHTTAFFEVVPAEILGDTAQIVVSLGLSDRSTVTGTHTYQKPSAVPEILFVHEPGDFGLVPAGLQPGSLIGAVAQGLTDAHELVYCDFGHTTLSDVAGWESCTPIPLEWWTDAALDEGLVDGVTPILFQMPFRMGTGYGELQIKSGDEVLHRLTARTTGFGEMIRLDQVGALFMESLLHEFGEAAYDFDVQGLYEPLEPGTVLLESYRDELEAQEDAIIVPDGEWWLSVTRIDNQGLDGWMVWQLANPETGEVLAYPQQSGWPVLQVDGLYNTLLGSRAFLSSGLFGIHNAVGIFPDIPKLDGWRSRILKDDPEAPRLVPPPSPSPSGQVPETDCVTVKRHALVVRYGNSSKELAQKDRWENLYRRKGYDTLDLLGPSTFRQPGAQDSTMTQLRALYLPLVKKYAAEAQNEPEYCHEILLHVSGHGVDNKSDHSIITNSIESASDWVSSPKWWGRTLLTGKLIEAIADSYAEVERQKVPQTAVIQSCFSGKLYGQNQRHLFPKHPTTNLITYTSSGPNEFTINDYFLDAMETCTDGQPLTAGWGCVATTVPTRVTVFARAGVWVSNSKRDRSQHPWVSVSNGVEPPSLKMLEVYNP